MGSSPSSAPVYLPDTDHERVKIIVAGPFGIGKTTMIHTLSEIPSLHTEEVMTDAAAHVDELTVADKKTTTVAIDFGRLTIAAGRIVLYLFGTPGQRRFKPMWSDYARGALGALVIVDTRRLADSFEVMDLIEESGLDYAVAVNQFPESPEYDEETLRIKLDVEDHTPVVICDARVRKTSLDALRALAAHLVSRAGVSL